MAAMNRGEWLAAGARESITEAVRAIEARTSAEVVVTVRGRSSEHRQVDLALGAVVAFVLLLVYVYAPITFADEPVPPTIALSFGVSALLSATVPAIKRALLSRKTRRAAVQAAARVAFFEQKIATTRARTGILVFVSLLEREIEIVADVGIDVAAFGEPWQRAVGDLEAAARGEGSVAAVAARLRALGDVLAAQLPISNDDVNELADEVAS